MNGSNILIAGNKDYGLAKEIYNLYPEAFFASRSSGYDLTRQDDQKRFVELIHNYKIVINCSALYKFNQTVLLDQINKYCIENNIRPHIICIGSTTDRVKKGGAWLYNAEKKALRDYSNTLGLNGVWNAGPKVTLISFGTLSNVQQKHPTRKCMPIEVAAQYIKWIIDQPKDICINEISIDPLQVTYE